MTGFTISPDSQYAVYTVATESGEPTNIWSVPVAGGTQFRLNAEVGTDGKAFAPQVSADSQWVVYSMRYAGETVSHLYSAPVYGSITGSERIKLNRDPAVGAAGVSSFSIAPDGTRVVYSAAQDRADAVELYSVPIRGPAASGTRLNPAFPSGRIVSRFQITPNSARVVYLADQDVNDRRELYSIPIAGGTPARLTGMISFANPDGEVYDQFQITPNSAGVVFRVNPTYASSYDLYAAALDGSAWRKLNPTLASGRTVSNFLVTPNNWGVVYRSNVSGNYQLYSRDVFATIAPLQLTGAVDGQYIDTILRITPDSQHVVYAADLDTDNTFEVYSFPTVGTDPAHRLRWNLPFSLPGSDVSGILLLPDSKTLIYTADREVDEEYQVFYAYYGSVVYLPAVGR